MIVVISEHTQRLSQIEIRIQLYDQRENFRTFYHRLHSLTVDRSLVR